LLVVTNTELLHKSELSERRFHTLAVSFILEEEEEESTVLLGGREPSMEGGEADSLHGKVPDEDQLAVDIPETAHQISKGFIFVLLSLPLSFSFLFFIFLFSFFSSF
jgi:hypothetical protein